MIPFWPRGIVAVRESYISLWLHADQLICLLLLLSCLMIHIQEQNHF